MISVINFSAGIEPGSVTKKFLDDFGGNQDFQTCQTLVQKLDKAGIVFVISAGNLSPGICFNALKSRQKKTGKGSRDGKAFWCRTRMA